MHNVKPIAYLVLGLLAGILFAYLSGNFFNAKDNQSNIELGSGMNNELKQISHALEELTISLQELQITNNRSFTAEYIENGQSLKLLVIHSVNEAVRSALMSVSGVCSESVSSLSDQTLFLRDDKHEQRFEEAQDWVNSHIQSNTFTMTKFAESHLADDLTHDQVKSLISGVVESIRSGVLDPAIAMQ